MAASDRRKGRRQQTGQIAGAARGSFAHRLRAAMESGGVTRAELARAVGTAADGRAVTNWRSPSGSWPEVEQLARIAGKLNVTTDWLLGLTGTDDVPERPGMSRSTRSLLRDFSAHLRGPALDRVRTKFPAVRREQIRIDAEALLREFEEMVAARALRNFERAEQNLHLHAESDYSGNVLALFETLAKCILDPESQRRAARVARRAHATLHRLTASAVNLESFEPGIGVRDHAAIAPEPVVIEPELRKAVLALELRAVKGERPALPLRDPSPYEDEEHRLNEEWRRASLAAGDPVAEWVWRMRQSDTPEPLIPEPPPDVDLIPKRPQRVARHRS